jgi:hypothetical protein
VKGDVALAHRRARSTDVGQSRTRLARSGFVHSFDAHERGASERRVAELEAIGELAFEEAVDIVRRRQCNRGIARIPGLDDDSRALW